MDGLGDFSFGEVKERGEFVFGEGSSCEEEGEEDVEFEFGGPSWVHVFPGSSAEDEFDVVLLGVSGVAELFQDSGEVFSAKRGIAAEDFLEARMPAYGLPEGFPFLLWAELNVILNEG